MVVAIICLSSNIDENHQSDDNIDEDHQNDNIDEDHQNDIN